jgi:hypothetical protein
MKYGQVIKISGLSIQINQASVLSRLGYRQGKTKLSAAAGRVLEAAFKSAETKIKPQGVYLTDKIKKKSNGTITFTSTSSVFRGRSITKLLSSCFAAILTAVTIGMELEELIHHETLAGNLEKALALDTIGSEAAEAAAESLNTHLISLARQEKLTLTKRYSPGYGDFTLDNQIQFFQALSLGDFEISIDKNFVLTPRKTITAVLGVLQ